MVSELGKYFARFLLLVFLQVLVLDHIRLSGYINPYLYVLFLAILPFETPGWLMLILGFILGLTIDMFEHTPGMHAAACVFTAFVRKYLLKFMEPRDGYPTNARPVASHMGLRWFVFYTAILILLHHLFLFYTEMFRFSEFFHTLLRVFLSFIFTMVLVVLSQYLSFTPKER